MIIFKLYFCHISLKVHVMKLIRKITEKSIKSQYLYLQYLALDIELNI